MSPTLPEGVLAGMRRDLDANRGVSEAFRLHLMEANLSAMRTLCDVMDRILDRDATEKTAALSAIVYAVTQGFDLPLVRL